MSHPVNTEILESLFEEQVAAVQKRFPLLHINKVEIIASKRAMRLFWEMAQWTVPKRTLKILRTSLLLTNHLKSG